MKQFFKRCTKKITGQSTSELKPQSPWRPLERIVQAKMPEFQKGTNVEIPMSNPDTAKPIMQRADKKEIPGILLKIISDVDEDRMRGKRLVAEAIKKNSNNPFLKDIMEEMENAESCPVSLMKTSTPGRGRPDGLEQVIETRDMSRAEILQLRNDFSQKGQTDGDFLFMLWSKGGESIRLSGNEVKQLNLQIDQPPVQEALSRLADMDKLEVRNLFEWVRRAWREGIPNMDLGFLEGRIRWNGPSEGIKLVKKLGVICYVYSDGEVPPLRSPLTAMLRRIILKGAPENHRIILSTALAGANTLWDVIEFLKQHRELQIENRMSFAATLSFVGKNESGSTPGQRRPGRGRPLPGGPNKFMFQNRGQPGGGRPTQEGNREHRWQNNPRQNTRNWGQGNQDWRKVRPGQPWQGQTMQNIRRTNANVGQRNFGRSAGRSYN